MRKDVFVALAAIAWADGELHPDEADAIVRAAADEGLSLEDIAAIEEATKSPVDLGTIDREGLSKADRLFIYAVACWIARMDGRITDEETVAVTRLGERLAIPDQSRARGGTRARSRRVAGGGSARTLRLIGAPTHSGRETRGGGRRPKAAGGSLPAS